jgi:hypothetical protein
MMESVALSAEINCFSVVEVMIRKWYVFRPRGSSVPKSG